MLPDFTPRNVTKYAVKFIIGGVVSQQTENAIVDHTQLEEDSIAVELAGGIVGWYVSDKLKPYTDKVVDKTFDFVAARRENRNNKKDTNEEK